jgi:hypothetical protein
MAADPGTSRKIAVLLEEATPGGAGLGLLDRFLIGYPRGRGSFALPPPDRSLSAYAPAAGGSAEIERRRADHRLIPAADPGEALADAGAVLVAPAGAGHRPWGAGMDLALRLAPAGARIFVHGVLGKDAPAARRAAEAAAARGLVLLSGGSLPVTWRLPAVDLEWEAELIDALIVAVGDPEEAEYLGAEGILPIVERRRGGESGVASVTAFRGEGVWAAAGRGAWPEDLLAAAISRSDRPQGDPVKDGRTQDLVGLRLLPLLARDPVAYAIEHRDGLRTRVLVLNGVIGDVDFAARERGGRTTSAQLYRPPAPGSHHLSRLAELVERFFDTGARPWPLERGILLSGLLDALRRSGLEPGRKLTTPDLEIAYRGARDPLFPEG